MPPFELGLATRRPHAGAAVERRGTGPDASQDTHTGRHGARRAQGLPPIVACAAHVPPLAPAAAATSPACRLPGRAEHAARARPRPRLGRVARAQPLRRSRWSPIPPVYAPCPTQGARAATPRHAQRSHAGRSAVVGVTLLTTEQPLWQRDGRTVPTDIGGLTPIRYFNHPALSFPRPSPAARRPRTPQPSSPLGCRPRREQWRLRGAVPRCLHERRHVL